MKASITTRHTQPLMVNIREAGELLSISPHTIRAHIKRGLIPHVRIGRRLLIPMKELRALTHPTVPHTEQLEVRRLGQIVA